MLAAAHGGDLVMLLRLVSAREVTTASEVGPKDVIIIGAFVLFGVIGWVIGTRLHERRRERRFRLVMHAWLVGWLAITGTGFVWALVHAVENA